ncbi:MAG: hypothetical protein AAF597_09880, partial [Bacteroidota bacterium]
VAKRHVASEYQTCRDVPHGRSRTKASRSHPFHYPANFFAGVSTYDYKGFSTGTTMGNVSAGLVLAGDMSFSNGGKTFKIGTTGAVLQINSQVGAGVTIMESAAGVGICYGSAIHDFKGIPDTLKKVTKRLLPADSVRFSTYLLPLPNTPSTLPTEVKAYLDSLILDAKVQYQKFAKKRVTVRLLASATGVWTQRVSPANFKGDVTKLPAAEQVGYNNYQTTERMRSVALAYVATELGSSGIPKGHYKLTSTMKFNTPIEHQRFVSREMNGSHVEVRSEPKGWRILLGSITAEL